MEKEKFTKALCLALVNERPEVVLKLLDAAGIQYDLNTPIMEIIHELRKSE